MAAPAPVAATPTTPVTGGTLSLQVNVDTMFTAVEVVCSSGFRQRSYFTDGAASFAGMPAESCTLSFKGGPPAQFTPITAGSWSCSYSGSTMSCDPQ
ncbi:MAG: hypothetical protein ACI8RZ_000842 [Myxococcota bacterium]|jgi:hypothetical protein